MLDIKKVRDGDLRDVVGGGLVAKDLTGVDLVTRRREHELPAEVCSNPGAAKNPLC